MKKLVIISMFFFAFSAQAELLCVKKNLKVKNNKVKLSKSVKLFSTDECPGGFVLVKDLESVKDHQLAAFATITQAAAVNNFGGAAVTSVSAVAGTGFLDVTFTGEFKGLTATDSADNQKLFTINSTGISNNYGVTNNYVLSATSSEVVVRVYIWKSDTTVLSGGLQSGLYVSLLQGTAPAI